MTREEAIGRIQEHRRIHSKKEPFTPYLDEAFDMAIEALKERPHITDKQISDAFQVAIVNYWESKSKYLTPPPSPCCDPTNIGGGKMKHGEWKPIGEPDDLGIHSWHICSSCGFRTTWHMVDIFHFCPNCGADMRKEGDENG